MLVFSFLLLTLNMEMPNEILYCLDLNLSKRFRVGFNMKLFLTVVKTVPSYYHFLSQRVPS